MKKYANRLLLGLIAAAAVVSLSGCEEQTESSGTVSEIVSELSGETLQSRDERIEQAFREAYLPGSSTEDALSVAYVGEFDGYCAVYVNGGLEYTQAENSETVDGVTFRYPTGQHLLVYAEEDGRLYTLREALAAGVLDRDGLRKIHDAHRAAAPGMYAEEVTDGEILRAYIERYAPKCRPEELSVAHVGVFGGCHAVYVNGPFAFADAFTTEIVGGMKFVYPTSQTVRIYRDGEIYTLPEAWNAGVISAEALGELHERFPNRDVRE